ncbi:MAG: elongation factor G [SAR202 cluster bacterium]|nr:elongation factor G [SAR202 cluster bacterium]MQG63350.1 elongation factor G [SAR202 cluster bacterium]MQG64215.1 elongation factor G [SAR202 cluster bacterium]|tara:strand:- start:498 stop:2546 length:2049 start_codon:yes stop_codon:yes gene_type:complete
MPNMDAKDLRNVALLGHSGSGKTSLGEAALFTTKATTRMGTISDGNTVSDFEPEEVKRGSSIQTALLSIVDADAKINFLDTPGYDDFLGEVVSALRVVEGAVLVLAAPSGVDVGTERSWNMCEAAGIPRMFVVNKMDRENANFARNVSDIQASFGRQCIPFQVPLGDAQEFKGVVSIINPPADIPAEIADEVAAARDRLIEAAAESDDDLADRYLSGEQLSVDEVISGVRTAVLAGELVPILATSSAPEAIGVEEFLETTRSFLPSPVDGKKARLLKGTEAAEYEVDPAAPLAAFVFKTTADPFVGKLSVFRVYQGSVKSNSETWNSTKEQSERIGQLYLPKGKNQENVNEITAGDIGAIGKLSSTVTGDTLCSRENSVSFPRITQPVGYFRMAVTPASKDDLDKMSMALNRIVEEDPTLQFSRDANTSESLITGLGDAQIDVALEKIKRKFGADLRVKMPKVAYRETITKITNSEYRHKKQSGGHGQFGHVLIRLEPQERDQGFEFKTEVTGGRIPKEYIPSVEKGVTKGLDEGSLAGFPLVDLKAVLYDGSYHDVDSSGMSFEIASVQALKQGVGDANPVLLEPVVKLSITVPDAYTGEVISDLNGKRGRILGMNPDNGVTLIEAEVPLAEVQRYAQDLRSVSQGRGSYSMEFDHYDQVPANLEPKVIEDVKRAKEEESV